MVSAFSRIVWKERVIVDVFFEISGGPNRYSNREENEPNNFSIKSTANKRRSTQSENWLIEGGVTANDVRWSDKKGKLNAKYPLYAYLLSGRKAWATIRTSIFGRSFSIGRRCHGISFLLFKPFYKLAQRFNRFGFQLNARQFHWICVCVCAFRVDYRAHDFSRTSHEMRHKMEKKERLNEARYQCRRRG